MVTQMQIQIQVWAAPLRPVGLRRQEWAAHRGSADICHRHLDRVPCRRDSLQSVVCSMMGPVTFRRRARWWTTQVRGRRGRQDGVYRNREGKKEKDRNIQRFLISSNVDEKWHKKCVVDLVCRVSESDLLWDFRTTISWQELMIPLLTKRAGFWAALILDWTIYQHFVKFVLICRSKTV